MIAGLANGVAQRTISLEDANLVARVVARGLTAQEPAAGMFIAERTAQQRDRRIGLRLADQAA